MNRFVRRCAFSVLLVTLGIAQAQKPKFKAIWEPVNYKEDLPLFDVYFVSKDEGWVSGGAGTILHTKDGGNSWTAELGGDPHAEGAELKHVFLVDATHGWAQSWNTLLRSTDGESWHQVSGDIRGDVFFVSGLKGFRDYGGKIFVTNDGGEKWKEGFACRAKMEVEGLTQEKDCDLWTLYFPTETVGYAAGDKRITAKTEDGGETWKVLVGPEEPDDQRVYDLFFLDASTGYEVRSSGLYRTPDGGHSWQGVIAHLEQGYPKVKFADPEVGWSCLGGTWAYTVDGGKHWTSRQVHFPTGVVSFSLPTRDRGYVVGAHGMIYRYRIVPIDYTSKGMMEAAMMPAASAAPGSDK
ncbi:MAG TPA: YCF48-related protein [Terriglobales bacterium]|nr:YCF48-related protein [Terriglobales bacterium]